MAFSGIIGLGLSLFVLLYCFITGGEFDWFVDVPSFILVATGSIAVTVTRYSVQEVYRAFGMAFAVMLRGNRSSDDVIEEMSVYAIKAEREGPASLTDFRAGSKDSFTEEGLALVAKGISPERIEHQMLPAVAAVARKYRNISSVLGFLARATFILAGLWFLASGMIILGNVGDPSSIGPAIAISILTPFYSLIAGAMIAMPLAGRVRAYGRNRQLNMMLQLDGFRYMAAGMVHTDIEFGLSVRLARLGIDDRLLKGFAIDMAAPSAKCDLPQFDDQRREVAVGG